MGKDQELIDASRNGNIVHVSKLLDLIAKRVGPLSSFRRSPSINTQDVNGYTPLHHACLNGHSDIVRLLLAYNATIDVPDIRGSTPLYLAAWAGHQEIVKMLLMHARKPANPNAQTSENETALHCAAQHGHNTVLAILLAYGADPSIRNNSFQTALDLAAQFGRLQAVQLLIRSHPELIAPFRNDDNHHKSTYSLAYPITPTTHIFTHSCLHLASRNGHKKVVETLLAAGVDVNVMTHAGSALHEAALCGKKSVVLTLLKAGVDPHAVAGNGRTVLDVLKDYPPHVTYDIVSTIKEFCNLSESEAHFRPIVAEQCYNEKEELQQNKSKEKGNSLPRTRYENQLKLNDNFAQQKEYKNSTLSSSLKSLDSQNTTTRIKENSKKTANTLPRASYLPMKAILTQTTSAESLAAKGYQYKPMYPLPKPKYDKSRAEPPALPPKPYELMRLGRRAGDTSSSSSCRNTPELHLRRVDEYVDMSGSYSATPTPKQSTTTTPTSVLHTPAALSTRNRLEHNNNNTNYTSNNLSDDMKSQSKVQKRTFSPAKRITAMDANNNKNQHSPTPDFPPPSVSMAERTIFEYIIPTDTKERRRSIKLDGDELENLDTYFYENAKLEEDETTEDIERSEEFSDHVEEFIADKPFAGLFKGSTLNLANDDDPILHERQPLRSPSLVKSIQPVPPARKASLKIRNLRETKEFSVSRLWAEIDDIFEQIDNEVQRNFNELPTDARQTDANATNNADRPTSESLAIRNPSELLLSQEDAEKDVAQQETATATPAHWLHPLEDLLYGQVDYQVYYLGSTVIRNLQGTASTRMSIQKLKLDERELDKASDADLLKDCTSSTKYLKANNLQTRLAVGIALSYLDVKFIDTEKQSMICIHATENINCVCQDVEDLRYFAYITKEQDVYYCHVFMVDNVDLAKEIILTLAQAFEIAYQLALTAHSAAE